MKLIALSIRVHLLILVGLALLPAMGILTLRYVEARRSVRNDVERECLLVAESLKAQEDRSREGCLYLLRTLARLPDIKHTNVGAINTLLENLQQEDPHIASLFAVDAKGVMYAANRPFQALTVSDRFYFKEVHRTRRMAAGDYVYSRLTGLHVIHFAYPLLDEDGAFRGLLGAGVTLSHQYDALLSNDKRATPKGLVLLDRQGTVVYSTGASYHSVGSAFPASTFATLRGNPTGSFRSTHPDGTETLVGFAQVALEAGADPYLYICVEVPENEVIHPIVMKLYRDLGLLIIAALAMGAFAWLAGEYLIVRRTQHLAQAAHRYAQGHWETRIGASFGGGELGDLARTLDDMGAALALREKERDRAEQEKAALQEQLRQGQKLQAIGQLAGGVAHDFNNQLAAIMGFSEIISIKAHEPEQRVYAEKILRTCERGADIVRKLLAFARRGKLHSVSMDLNAIAQEALGALEMPPNCDIKVVLDLRPTPTLMTGDPTQIQQAVRDILQNAVDAMPDGGELRVRTDTTLLDAQAARTIKGQIHPGPHGVIEIQDNGCGMSPEVHEHLFEPFFTTKPLGKGTGLGLAGAYGIAQNHNGNIEVQSALGQGCTVRLYFPIIG